LIFRFIFMLWFSSKKSVIKILCFLRHFTEFLFFRKHFVKFISGGFDANLLLDFLHPFNEHFLILLMFIF
jgi:hypothetical protein